MTGHAKPAGEAPTGPDAVQRLDKWLWFARVVKSRTLAAQLVQDGKVRVNRAKVAKPAQTVRPDDVLTIVIRGNIQVLKVLAPGARRGPPAEARQLYELLSPPVGAAAAQPVGSGERVRGTGRPSKRERRLIDRLTEHE
jgi:ribosome-associated heat shock protein Hsp15